nr:(d)CMP kinase [Marinicella sp. W31]MDC2879432.1 (d)CMP kinase [Marinicella sp. W31]
MNTNKAEAALPRAIIVMGVSGCGKSSIARLLAERLGYEHVEETTCIRHPMSRR